MTRYWSDQFGIYIDGENVWDGRASLTDGLGWRQRDEPLTAAAPYRSGRQDALKPTQPLQKPWQPKARSPRGRCRGCGTRMLLSKLTPVWKLCQACKGRQSHGKAKREAA